jgi:hypothetical protein
MTFRSVLLSRPSSLAQTARPSLTLFFLLVGAFLLTLVPHVPQFPLWLSVTVVAAMVLRCVLEVYRLPLPSTTFCGILALVLLGAIFWQFSTMFGREAGTAFTAGLLAIKFYELRRPRDVALVIFSCFFVVMSALLYSQALELFVYCLIMMWVLIALLLRVHTGDLPQDQLLRMLRHSGFICLQTIPLALFLFFFFPRYQGTLSLALEQNTIGLTDTVSPGSIASLSQNESEAMYVKFLSGIAPPVNLLYWRALVLWDYNNGTWTPGSLSLADPFSRVTGVDSIAQEITIRPNNQKWLYALDTPISIGTNPAQPYAWSKLANGNVLQLILGRLDNRARYTVVSSSTLEDVELKKVERDDGVFIPAGQIDPRVQALADRLHQGLTPDQTQEYSIAVLQFFRRGGFTYNATPGIQGKNWLPVFLFTAKTGFCEHFASAFALLMRLEKIPARLIVGYQGATYNPYADNYIVSQSNAHAWVEIWIDAKNQPAGSRMGRWLRIDPTAMLGISEANLAEGGSGNANDPLSIKIAQRGFNFEDYMPAWVKSSLVDLRLRREQVETNWDNLLFSYDPEAQGRLAQALGFGQQARIFLVLGCVLASGICIIVFRQWLMRRTPLPPVEKLYAAFCRNMARRGIPRAIWEGPFAYTERVAEAFPDDRLAIRRVGSIVARERYGISAGNAAAPHNLQSLLTVITALQAASPSRDRR